MVLSTHARSMMKLLYELYIFFFTVLQNLSYLTYKLSYQHTFEQIL